MVMIGIGLLGWIGLYFIAAIAAVGFRPGSIAARIAFAVMVGSATVIIIGLVGGAMMACLGWSI